jgi:hypothetical protein
VERVVFTGEFLCKVGIAFPLGGWVAIVEARITIELASTISGETAMLKRIAVRVPDHLSWIRIAVK